MDKLMACITMTYKCTLYSLCLSLSRIFSVFVYFSSYFPNHFLVDLLSIKRQNICSILVKRNYTETYHSDAQTMKNDGLMLYCYIVFFFCFILLELRLNQRIFQPRNYMQPRPFVFKFMYSGSSAQHYQLEECIVCVRERALSHCHFSLYLPVCCLSLVSAFVCGLCEYGDSYVCFTVALFLVHGRR